MYVSASEALKAYMNDYEGDIPAKHGKFLSPKAKSIDKTLYNESSYLEHQSASNNSRNNGNVSTNNSSNGFVDWVNLAYQNHIDSTCEPAYSGPSQHPNNRPTVIRLHQRTSPSYNNDNLSLSSPLSDRIAAGQASKRQVTSHHSVGKPKVRYNDIANDNTNKSLISQYSSVTSLLRSPTHKQNFTETREQDFTPMPHTSLFESDTCSVDTEILLECSIYGNNPVNMAGVMHTSLDHDDHVTRLLNESRNKKKKHITNVLSRTIHGTDTRNNEEHSSWLDTLPDYRNSTTGYTMKNGNVSYFFSPSNRKSINPPQENARENVLRMYDQNREEHLPNKNKTGSTRENIPNNHAAKVSQNMVNKNPTNRNASKSYLANAPHSRFFSPKNATSYDINNSMPSSSRRDSQQSDLSQRTDQLLRSAPNGIKYHRRSQTWHGTTIPNNTSTNHRNFIPLQSSSPLKDGISSNFIDMYKQDNSSIGLKKSPTRDSNIITSNTRKTQEQLARQNDNSYRENLMHVDRHRSPNKHMIVQPSENFKNSQNVPTLSSRPNASNSDYDYIFRRPNPTDRLTNSLHGHLLHQSNKKESMPSARYNTSKTENISFKKPSVSNLEMRPHSSLLSRNPQFDNTEIPDPYPDIGSDTASIDTNILLLQTSMPIVNASPSLSTVSDDSSDATARAQFLFETEDDNYSAFNQHNSIYPLAKKQPTHSSAYQLWQKPPQSPRKNQSVEKSKLLNSFIDDCVMTSGRENLLHGTADQSEYLSGGSHPSSVEAIKQLVYNLQSLDTNPEIFKREDSNHRDHLYHNETENIHDPIEENKNDYSDDDESLTRAYYHLNKLKELVNERGY